MAELFFDGYSQYELQALRIPSQARGKCLKQLVNLTHCLRKQGILKNSLLNGACDDEQFRFERCHRKSVNYYSGSEVGLMMHQNPSAFREKGVSETYETFFPTPTPFNINR